ncbi:MAG TPA: signal protein PDZ, partial [Planctomycetes bacterium]|nr:signal protein PDZ [Planctomycetota bacterium]
QAGLRADDLVFRVGRRTIRSCRDFDEAVAGLEPGSKVSVVVKRGEECLSLELTLPEEEEK